MVYNETYFSKCFTCKFYKCYRDLISEGMMENNHNWFCIFHLCWLIFCNAELFNVNGFSLYCWEVISNSVNAANLDQRADLVTAAEKNYFPKDIKNATASVPNGRSICPILDVILSSCNPLHFCISRMGRHCPLFLFSTDWFSTTKNLLRCINNNNRMINDDLLM